MTLTLHATERAQQRLGLGPTEAAHRAQWAQRLSVNVERVYCASRAKKLRKQRRKAEGAWVEIRVSQDLDGVIVWVIDNDVVITVYRERKPALRTMLERDIAQSKIRQRAA